MEPEVEEEEEEEESEFGEDDELPLSGHQPPQPTRQQMAAPTPETVETGSLQSSPDEDEIPQIKASVQPKVERFT